MHPDVALTRLQDPTGPHATALAGLVLTDLLDRPLRDLVPPDWMAHRLVLGLRDATAEPTLRDAVIARIDQSRAHLGTLDRPVRSWIPPEVEPPARKLLSLPWSPSEELTFRVINHPALRALVREVLSASLTRFTDRLRSLDQGVLGGLGGRAMRRGQGLFGGVAESLVGAVRDEFGASFDSRIKDHLGTATEEAVRAIAAWLADPAHADALAAMRLSALDVVLDTPVRQLTAEGEQLSTATISAIVWEAARELAARDDLEPRLVQVFSEALEVAHHDTLGGWLDELGLRATWTGAASDWLTARIVDVARSAAFAVWWEELHR
jgi:hypothetical protein